ncbi:hypothetical protein [Kocuria massiliensis]|uniref:hypothetical protein n=1 Tax=Kocuria massiliensis TaxID=1926282 RepID=UPI0022B98D86|nr:hypothetical protein [Kocuria massiliensis]
MNITRRRLATVVAGGGALTLAALMGAAPQSPDIVQTTQQGVNIVSAYDADHDGEIDGAVWSRDGVPFRATVEGGYVMTDFPAGTTVMRAAELVSDGVDVSATEDN